MGKDIGIQLDEQTNDLKISVKRDLTGVITRGVVIGNITTQNQFVLLTAHAGELKNAPTAGVGISNMLLDNNSLFWRMRIREALEDEGLKIKVLDIKNSRINIESNY